MSDHRIDKHPSPERPWTTRHRVELVDRDSHLLQLTSGRNVIHLGCTDMPFTESKLAGGSLLHNKLAESTRSLVGIDTDVLGLSILKRHDPSLNLLAVDALTLPNAIDSAHPWDTILAADILEHVPDLLGFLTAASRILPPNGQVILTTINALSIRPWLRALFRIERVHPDHIAYFSPATLATLAMQIGLTTDNWFTFTYPYESRLMRYIAGPVQRAAPLTADGVGCTLSRR